VFKELKSKVGANEKDILTIYHEIYERFAIACLTTAEGFKCKVEAFVGIENLRSEDKSTFNTNSKFYNRLGFLIWHEPNKKIGNPDELFIPELNSSVNFESCKLKKGRTAKYEHYNDKTLPEAMTKVSKRVDDPLLAKVLEKAEGIGTEATIVDIIDTVIIREYVEVSGDKYKLTTKGAHLIEVIEKDLCSPQLSAAWELRLTEIEEEKDPKKAEQMRDLFLAKQRKFIENKVGIIKEKFNEQVGKHEVVRYSGDGTPSKKQVAFARKLSKDKSILLSPKTLKSVVETNRFIDEALKK
jgi:DNA topoisomerase IA